LNHYISHTKDLIHYLNHSLLDSWPQPFPVIKIAIRLGLLRPTTTLSQSLLPDWQKQEALHTALDKVHKRYGLFSLKPALLAKHSLIKPEVTGFFGDKQYHLN